MCKKILCGALAAVSFFVIFTTCKIGLGESVDTEPPRIKFTSPDTSAVVRGTIDLKGSCTDERKVNTVKVTLTSVDQEKILINGADATVNNLDSSWNYLLYSQTSSEVPSGAVILPDGKYEAKAVAYDDAGHASGEASRAFEIDGTPPVVALSKPASIAVLNSSTSNYEIQNASSFGRNVKIRGLISDDHSISSLKIRIFKADGTEITLAKSEFSDFDPSDTSVTIARFFNESVDPASEDYKLYENFKAIYADEGEPGWNTKQYYYAIVNVTDKAGNISKHTYIKTNLLSLVKEVAGQELEMADLKNIINGTYKGSLNKSKSDEIKAILDGTSNLSVASETAYIADDDVKLTFSIDSRANPTYEVMGGYAYKPGEDLHSLEQIGTINIRATFGLDETEFKPNEIGVRFIKLNSSTSIDDAASDNNSLEIGPDLIFTSDGTSTLENNNIPTDTGTYTLKLTEIINSIAGDSNKKAFFSPGKSYRLEVFGHDIDGNEFIPSNDNTYLFTLKSTSLPSDANCEKNKTYVKASDFNFLDINVTDDLATSQIDVNVWVKYYDSIVTTAEYKSTDAGVIEKFNRTGIGPGSIKINFDSSDKTKIKNLGVGTVVVKVLLVKGDSSPTERYFYIYTDNLAPGLIFTNTELQNPSASVYVHEDHSISSSSPEKSNYYWNNGKYTVRGTWNEMYEGREGSGGIKLCYTFDNTPIIGSGNWVTIDEKEAKFAIKPDTSWEAQIPVDKEDQGVKKISFYAEDAVGNKTDIITFNTVIFDFEAPKIEYINTEAINEYYEKNGTTVDFTFKVSDSYKLASDDVNVEFKVKKNDEEIFFGYEIIPGDNNDEKNRTYTLKFYRDQEVNSGLYEITGTVTDASNRKTSKITYFGKQEDSLKFVIDAKKPVYKNNSLTIKDSAWDDTAYYDNDTLAVTAEFEEENEMDSLYYWIKTSDYNLGINPTDLTKLTDYKTESFKVGQQSISFTASGFKDNIGPLANTLYIQGKDKAGNLSDVKAFKINLDTKSTNIGVGFYKVDNGKLNLAGGTVYVNGTKPLTIYGYYDDLQSGVEELILHIGNTDIPSSSVVFTYSATVLTKDENEIITSDWITTAEAEGSQTPFKEYSKFTDKTTIRTWKAVYTPTKSGALTLFGKNGAQRECTSTLFTISFDTDLPAFNNISINTSSTKNSVLEDGSIYWVNNTDQTFTFAGIATDSTGVENVILNIGGTLEADGVTIAGGENHNIDSGEGISASRWKFSGINLSSLYEETSAILKVTDIAGNEFAVIYTIKFDTVAPIGVHAIDTTGKDLYFRIGEQERDEGKPVTGSLWNPVWTDGIDKDVGGKYSTDTFGNSQTIKIRGTFVDKVGTSSNSAEGSGIKMIYYKIYDTQPDVSGALEVNTTEYFRKNYVTIADGYFSPIKESDKTKEGIRRVFYSDENSGGLLTDRTTNVTFTQPADSIIVLNEDGTTSTKYYRNIESTFKTTISGLVENKTNYIAFVIVDNVGNVGVESVKVPGFDEPFSNYQINVDTLPPVVPDLPEYNITKFVNSNDSNSSVTIEGTATDIDGAGIDKNKLTVKVNGKRITTKDNTYGMLTVQQEGDYSKTNSHWKVVIKNTAFTGISSGSTTVVQIEATDKAGSGNTATYTIGNVEIDTTAPVPAFIKPVANATVNKTISINGKITEKNSIKSIILTAKSGTKTPIVFDYIHNRSDGKLDSISYDADTKEWSIDNIDTTDWYNETDSEDWILTLKVTDEAENTSAELVRTITVDQNSDRPIIKVSQVDSTGTGFVTVKTMFGQIDDDDKTDDVTVNKLWLWSKQLNTTIPTSAPSYENGSWHIPSGWIEFGKTGTDSSLDNNSWQIDSKESDGETVWFWAVADTTNNVFWTTASDPFQRPYIIYKGETSNVDNLTGLSFKYDTIAPEITKIELMRLPTKSYKTGTSHYKANEITNYVSDYNFGKQDKDQFKWVTEDNYVFGADYALMYMKVSVKEETGMALFDYANNIYPIKIEGLTEKTSGNTSKVVINEESFYESYDSETHVYTYIVGPIDFTSYPMNENAPSYPKVNMKVTARDGAGKTSPKEKSIFVDNKANITITKVVPEITKETSGEFEFRVNLKDRESDLKNVQYYIPLSTENSESSIKALAENKWTDVTELTLDGCVIEFTDFNTVMGYEIDKTTNQAKVKTGFEEYEIKSNGEGQGIYNVPVWFKVTDEVGNIGYINSFVSEKNADGTPKETASTVIKYNPNTDRPKVYINDPAITVTPVEKGGKIKISGSAEDNEGIAAVYLQFDKGTGTFENGPDTVPVIGVKAHKANNTKNWNYTLDVAEIQNEKIVRVRAIAIDTDTTGQLASAWSDVLSIKVNNTVPSFENMYLRQYDRTTLKVEKEYQIGMFVKGAWILEGTVSTVNSDHLKQLSIGGITWNRTSQGNGNWSATAYPGATVSFVQGSGDKSIKFTVPVSGSSGKWDVEIEAYDNADNHNSETPTIYIDENAPKFADYVGNESLEVIKLYQDSYGGSGRELGDSNFLKNSNGSKFTLAGKVNEPDGESGFEKAVFYFERFTGSGNSKSNPRVYNVMEGRGKNNNANKTNVAASKSDVNTTNPIYINSDKLPVLPLTVTRTNSGELSADEIKTNLNIRNGGIVLVGGLYRTITGINRTTGVVNISPADETLATEAEFVYGMVVDHNGEGENSDGTVRNDDGDGMLESYSGSQSAGYRWEATFNSANIPDGPIEIHIVVFDQAGNIGHGYIETRASNNAPRITKVMLGTDLNGNGVFDYGSGEFNTFYAQKDDNQNPITKTGLENWNLKTKEHLGNSKSWKVKNGIAVIPEFVGGAPDFYYQFSKASTSLDEPEKITTGLSSRKLLGSGENTKIKLSGTDTNATWDYSTNKVDGVDVTNYGGSLTMTTAEINAASGTATEDAEVYYRFTFWDSTEESTPGTDTGSTILNIQLIQDLTDNVSPTAEIDPFTWNGTGYTKQISTSVNGGTATTTAELIETLKKGEGGSYVLGTETVTSSTTEDDKVTTTVTKTTVTPKNSLYGASKTNGHIELQEHIKDISAITSALGSDDPKVSGKITFHGTAFDETRLSSIWFKFDSFTPTKTLTGGDSSKTPATGYSQAAYYNKTSATWTLASAKIADGWEISVTDKEFSQDGHTVDWYLSIDTAKISGVAGKDKAFTIVAMDASGGKSTIGSVDQTIVNADGTAHKTPYYRVDVVPYIKGISTSLDEAYASDSTAFSRSALGGYPVLRGENGIVISGFNFASFATVTKGNKTSADDSTITISIPNDATTGNLDVTVNTITSLNNLNDVSLEYNKEPNTSNNRILNNRRKFYVWENSHKTVDATLDSTIRYTTFRVGPNGEEVFSFDLGGDSTYLYKDGSAFKVGGSFTQWYDTAVSIDNNGNLYGLAINGDNASRGSTAYSSNARFHFYPLVGNNTNDVDTYTTSALAPAWENDSNGTVYNPNRVQNPKLVTTSENGVNKIYSTYYDISEKLVKFRAGTIQLSQNTTATFTRYNNGKPNNGSYLYSSSGTGLGGKYIEINGSYRLIKRYNNTYYTIAGCNGENITGTKVVYDINLSDSISNYADDSETGSAPGYQTIASGNSASAYSALAVAADGTAIVCWYDSVAKSLKLKYNTSPLTSDSWSTAITIDSGLAGWYPDMVLDKDGGIHIAYYGAKNGDLKYAYLTSYTDVKADVCTVDSFLSVGTKASISVSTKKHSFTVGETTVEKYVPFVSYYMSAFTATQTSVRTAWPVELGTNEHSEGTNTYIDGVNADMFTGSWEVQTLPLDSFPSDYTIGIGVKNTSTIDAAAAKAEGNIILGYGTTEGLETARLY